MGLYYKRNFIYMKNQNGFVSIALAILIVVLIIGGVIYSLVYGGKESTKLPETNTITNQEGTKSAENTSEKKTMEQTSERVSKNGDTLVMNYTGRLTNGTVFDSNVDPKFGHVQPFEFVLGAGMVIKGWDEGLVGMKIGEKKTLNIPAEKGYGARGAGSAIPPNADLVFDVELVGIK